MTFKCSLRRRCIHADLQCNGYHNCGQLDNTDTEGCQGSVGGEYTHNADYNGKDTYQIYRFKIYKTFGILHIHNTGYSQYCISDSSFLLDVFQFENITVIATLCEV